MEAPQSKAEQASSSAISSSTAPSGYRGRVLSGALGIVVMVGLIWGYFWQVMPEPDRASGGFFRQVLFPIENPRIATAPVLRAGADGGFIPQGLCIQSSTYTPETRCAVFPDGRLFLPRTDRGPRFLRQLIRDPENGRSVALSLEGTLFENSESDEGRFWAEGVQGLLARGLDESSLELIGHQLGVWSVSFSLDGTRLASSGDDGTIRLWDPVEGSQIGQPLRGHDGLVYSVSFSPNGEMLVSSGDDATIRIWSTANGLQIGDSLAGHDGWVRSAAFSPDGQLVVSGGSDGTIRFWDVETTEQVVAPLTGHSDWVNSVAFSSDGKRVVSGSRDLTIRVWDVHTKTQIGSPLTGHSGDVSRVAFSPDGERILSASIDGEMRIWDAETGDLQSTIRVDTTSIDSFSFSPDGRFVASVGRDGHIYLLNASDLSPTSAPLRAHTGQATAVDFSPDGTQVASAGLDGVVRLTNLQGELFPLGQITSIAFHGEDEILGVGTQGLLATSVPEAEGWQVSSPEDLRTVDFLAVDSKARTAMAVGSNRQVYARILESDGDWSLATVEPIPGDDPVPLRAIHVADGGRFWAAGSEGAIFASIDAGENWRRQNGSAGLDIDSLFVTDEGVGWAAGVARGRPVWLFSSDAATGNWTVLRHLPAPWWFALLAFGLPLALYSNVLAWSNATPRIEQSMANYAVNDLPLDWSGDDALGLKPLARSLSRFLRNVDTKPPLTIAVTGRWGSGKSSLMNLLRHDLRRRGASTVWFNAWHHRGEEHLFAALMEAIRTEGVPSLWTVRGAVVRLKLGLLRSRRQLSTLFMLLVVAVLSLIFFWAGTWLVGRDAPTSASLFIEMLGIPTEEVSDWLSDILGWNTADDGLVRTGFAAIISAIALWFAAKRLIPFPIKPAALLTEIAARTSISRFSDKLSFRHLFGNALGEVATVLRSPTSAGLVIFIDDLDRCHPDHVLSVLEAVNFVVSEGPCIVVMGMDRQQVEHAVGLAFAKIAEGLPDAELGLAEMVEDGDVDPKSLDELKKSRRRSAYAQRYMEKLVNLEIAVPSMQQGSVGKMVGADRGNGNSAIEASEYDPGKLHRLILPVWALVGRMVVPLILAFLVAVPLVFAPAPNLPPIEMAVQENGETQISPVSIGTGAEGIPEPNAELESPETERQRPVALDLSSDIAPEPIPSWAWWATSFMLLGAATVLIASQLLRTRQLIRKDSPDFRTALSVFQRLLHRPGVTPRDIRRWENRMRFLAERQRANEHVPDTLETALRFLDQKLGSNFVSAPVFQVGPEIPEPTLIALGAIDFAFPGILESESGGSNSNWSSQKDNDTASHQIRMARREFEKKFSNITGGFWPDDRAADRYLKLSRYS